MKDKDFPFEKLNNCPFCGNDNINVNKGDEIIYCDCGACKTIPPDLTDEEIIKEWNTRQEPNAQAKRPKE